MYDILPKGVIVTSITMDGYCDHALTTGLLNLSLTGVTPGILTATGPALDFTTSIYTPSTVITPLITPANTNSGNTYVNNASEALTVTIGGANNIQNGLML